MLFQQMSELLQPGEQVVFTISKESDGLAVLLQPVLNSVVEAVSDHIAQARAALSMPLKLAGTASELDTGLVDTLTEFGARRTQIRNEIPALLALKEQAKATQAAAKTAGRTQAKPAAGDGASEPAPATAAPVQTPTLNTNPDSLI